MRELSLRLLLTWIICIIVAGLFAFIARAIQLDTITGFDNPIIHSVQGLETPWLTAVMKTFTSIGSTLGVAVLSVIVAVLLFWKHHRAQALLFIAVIGGTGVINQLLKFIFQRERPSFHRLIDISGYSFPSGHTMMAFSMYTILCYIIWRNLQSRWARTLIICAAAVMIIMIALSRIYLGVHFPSDIVAGLLASALWVTVSIAVYRRFQRNKAKHRSFS